MVTYRKPASLGPVTAGTSFGDRLPDYDVFVDLVGTGLGGPKLRLYLEALAGDACFNLSAGRITVAVPEEPTPSTCAANLVTICDGLLTARKPLHRAIRGAAQKGSHLVVILGSILPGNEIIRRLIQEFERDPLFGMVQPRFADASTDHVWPLPGDRNNDDSCATLTRLGLMFLPGTLITPELLSACIVFRREVVREMDGSDWSLSVAGEIRHLLTQARRRGYRNIIVNRAVTACQAPYASLYPTPPRLDTDQLRMIYPEIDQADSWCGNLSQRKLEAILARAYAHDSRQGHHLLLDCRGMTSLHNGTSHSILGLLDGFQALDCPWRIDVVASSDAIRFFDLTNRYPSFRVTSDRARDTYMAAVLLNQPWTLSTIEELHRNALLIAFNILDTISWDILYVCDENLDAVWRFVARYSDALFYDSQFTRDRFATRFPLQSHVAEQVTYLSLARDEQVEVAALEQPTVNDILLIGNDYDHKDVRRTLQILIDAFPYARIAVIGVDRQCSNNVIAMQSGKIEHTVLHRLLAGARVIVFPSFYEGFGMPVVQGLAYGRTVVVRQSSLWREILAHTQMPGDLVQFDSTVSLIEAVGRTLAGLPMDPSEQGVALRAGESPMRWRDCARQIINTLEKLLPTDASRWYEREEALRTVQLRHT